MEFSVRTHTFPPVVPLFKNPHVPRLMSIFAIACEFESSKVTVLDPNKDAMCTASFYSAGSLCQAFKSMVFLQLSNFGVLAKKEYVPQ